MAYKSLLANENLISFLEDMGEYIKKQNPNQLTHLEHTIMYYYPLFEKHYHVLIQCGIMTKKENDNLLWLCNTQSLVFYFDEIKPEKLKKHKWNEIQELFSITRNLSDVKYQTTDYSKNNDYFYRIKPLIDRIK